MVIGITYKENSLFSQYTKLSVMLYYVCTSKELEASFFARFVGIWRKNVYVFRLRASINFFHAIDV